MAELGKGSLATYELLAQVAARSNVDAARGYFPELESGKKALPKKLVESEMHIVKLSEELQTDMMRSPHYVQTRDRVQVSGWKGDLQTVEDYYFGSSKKKSSSSSPSSSEKEKGKTQSDDANKTNGYSTTATTATTASTTNDSGLSSPQSHTNEKLWQVSKCWYIAELLPVELIPKRVRSVKRELGVVESTRRTSSKRAKQGPSSGAADGSGEANENGSFVSRLKQEANKIGSAENDEHGDEVDGEADNADGADNDPDAAVANDDDDDLELDADYQTGITFDDDEGYEEQDSGAEEATF